MVRISTAFAALLLGFLGVSNGQELPELPKPTSEHEWLKQLAGEWDRKGEATFDGQPPITCEGSESARMLGGFWLVSEGKASPMGMPMESLMTLGYDEKKGHFVGTWTDSMNSHMWTYAGTLDPTRKILTLNTEGPNLLKAGAMTKFRDIIEIKDRNHRLLTSEMQSDNGRWITFMTATYTRRK